MIREEDYKEKKGAVWVPDCGGVEMQQEWQVEQEVMLREE